MHRLRRHRHLLPDAIITQLPNVKKVICNNHSPAPAEKLAAHVREAYGVEAVVEPDLEAAVRQADVISVAASRTAFLNLKGEWVKPGCTILASGPIHFDQEEGGSYDVDGGLWTKMKVVYDHIGLHHAYVEDAIATGDKEEYYAGVIGGPVYHLIDLGKKEALDDSLAIGKIILGQQQGRTNDDDIICFIACGMSVFDLGLGYELYQTALEKNIGTKLLLWENPAQCE